MAAAAADVVTVVPEAWRLLWVWERDREFSRYSGGRRGPARADGAGACMREETEEKEKEALNPNHNLGITTH